jgi:hypothetical protein
LHKEGGNLVKENSSLRVRRIVLVVSAAAGLCIVLCLALVLFTLWRQRRMLDRMETAVRSGFPAFCAGPGETMVIEKSQVHVPLFYDTWDVSCEPQRSSAPWPGPAMTVNVRRCTVTRPMIVSMEWEQVYGELFTEGQKMPVCP